MADASAPPPARGGDGVEVVVDAVEVVVDGRHTPRQKSSSSSTRASRRRDRRRPPRRPRRAPAGASAALARADRTRDKLGKVIAEKALRKRGTEGREDGSSRPRETRRRRRLRGWSGRGKSGKGGGEVHTSFQGKIRASPPPTCSTARKRLEQRAFSPWHSPSAITLRWMLSVPKRARESDRPIASRFSFFTQPETRGPKRATSAAQRGARRHGLVHRRPRTEAGARRALVHQRRGARNV